MAERFPTEIRIGGRVNRKLLPDLMNAINDEELQDTWGHGLDRLVSEDRLLQYVDNGCLQFCNDEGVSRRLHP
jgi:hypothetical protein